MAEDPKKSGSKPAPQEAVKEVKRTLVQQIARLLDFGDVAADTSILVLLGWLLFGKGRGLPSASQTDPSKASQAPDLDDEGFFWQILAYLRRAGGALGEHWADILTEVHAALGRRDRKHASDFRKIATTGVPRGEIRAWIQKLLDAIQPRLSNDTRRQDLLAVQDANIVALADICMEVEEERTAGGQQLTVAEAADRVVKRRLDQGWLPKTLTELGLEKTEKFREIIANTIQSWDGRPEQWRKKNIGSILGWIKNHPYKTAALIAIPLLVAFLIGFSGDTPDLSRWDKTKQQAKLVDKERVGIFGKAKKTLDDHLNNSDKE